MRTCAGLLALLLAGCSAQHAAQAPSPDAFPGLHYELIVLPTEPAQRPPRTLPPQVFIDGVARTSITLDYASYADALQLSHEVQLRAGDVIVADYVAGSGEISNCSFHFMGAPVTSYSEGVCEYDSGDLRAGSSDGTTANGGGCNGDSFCTAQCSPANAAYCGAGMHCTARAPSIDPLYSHLACAPLGTKQLGDACSFIPDRSGAYDDCADGLLCVAGTCHALCNIVPPTCTPCTYVDGEPPELTVCM